MDCRRRSVSSNLPGLGYISGSVDYLLANTVGDARLDILCLFTSGNQPTEDTRPIFLSVQMG